MELNLADLTEVDRDYVPGLLCIRDMMPEGKDQRTLSLLLIQLCSQESTINSSEERYE